MKMKWIRSFSHIFLISLTFFFRRHRNLILFFSFTQRIIFVYKNFSSTFFLKRKFHLLGKCLSSLFRFRFHLSACESFWLSSFHSKMCDERHVFKLSFNDINNNEFKLTCCITKLIFLFWISFNFFFWTFNISCTSSINLNVLKILINLWEMLWKF